MRFLVAAALALGASEAATAVLNVACQQGTASVTLNDGWMDYTCSVQPDNSQSKDAGEHPGTSPALVVNATNFSVLMETSWTITSLDITGDDNKPKWTGYSGSLSFTNLTKLRTLYVGDVSFENENSVTLALPNTITNLTIADVALTDLSLTDGSNALTSISVSGADFTQIPTFLYATSYANDASIVVDLSSVSENTTISAAQLTILNSNLKKISETYATACSSNTEQGQVEVSCNFNKSSTSTIHRGSSSSTYNNPSGDSATSSQSGSSSAEAGTGDSGGGVSTGVLVVIIVLVIIIALVLGYFIMKMYYKRKNASASAQNEAAATLMSKGDASGDKGSFISNDEFLRNFRLPQSDVSLIKSVGTGRLWMGEYNESKVIVKRVESEVTDSYVTKALMAQARTFATISHPNITSLVGVTWLAGTDFAVVTEFMDKGNLKTVLSNSDVNLDVGTKLQMCLDVAQALAYLHETEQNLCAKQLSSRKVLVNSALTCKLSLFECVPCSAKLGGPNAAAAYSYGMGEVVWLPPEVITRSSPMDARKNNIYAFGVLISEIFTRVSPYQALVEEQGNTMSDVELVKRVRRQEPLVPHENRREFLEAPASVRQLVEQCLSYAPMSRPTAKDLVDCLQAAKEELQTNSV